MSANPVDLEIHSIPTRISSKPTYLLLESHNLEAIEVGQVLPPLSALGLLGVVALSPLAVDLVSLPELGDRAGASGTGHLGDDEGGQGGVGESEDMTGDDLLVVCGGAVNQDLISRYLSTTQVPMSTGKNNLIFPREKFPENVHACGRQSRQSRPACRCKDRGG